MSDALKDIQVQEIKENLQELLLTLKQLGKEVSDNIQEHVSDAELKIEDFKINISKFQKDLNKVKKLSDELNMERVRLEEKTKTIEASKNKAFEVIPQENQSLRIVDQKVKKNNSTFEFKKKTLPRSIELNILENNKGISAELMGVVYHLEDLHVEMNEIVRRTKLSRAEIQLILNLRENRFVTSELSAAKS